MFYSCRSVWTRQPQAILFPSCPEYKETCNPTSAFAKAAEVTAKEWGIFWKMLTLLKPGTSALTQAKGVIISASTTHADNYKEFPAAQVLQGL